MNGIAEPKLQMIPSMRVLRLAKRSQSQIAASRRVNIEERLTCCATLFSHLSLLSP